MTVVLKEQYQTDEFIKKINEDLLSFGASKRQRFNPWHFLQQEADFMNTDPDGLKQLADWERPITPRQLSENFFWLRHGTFDVKLSGSPTLEEALDAIAVSKWITATKQKYINTHCSDHYERQILSEYLKEVLIEEGLDLSATWE